MEQDPLAPEHATAAVNAEDWRSRVIAGRRLGAAELPAWAEESYQALRREVTDDAYPCFFGVQAEKRGEMFYGFVTKRATDALSDTMARFTELARTPAYEKHNMAVFFEPDDPPLSHPEYHDLFWRTLQSLHDADTHPHADSQVDPADPAWEFCYQGIEMFVVCACPSFGRRHSRNLGPGMVLLFQPRSVFIDKITNKVIGRRAREQVRRRLLAWDDVQAHPDLGFYGDPGNLEWKQYFLPDDNQPIAGACPFSSRRSKGASQHSTQHSPEAENSPIRLRADDAARVAGDYPLTPAQGALWFLWRLDPDSAAHNISVAIQLDGSLHADVLQRALICMIERHAMLRTGFVNIGGMARQCVDDDATHAIDWNEHDLRDHAQPMARAYELLQDRGNRNFDLGGDGLLRATLLRVAASRHVLQLCTHHIIADAWSFDLLCRELLECYASSIEGRASRLPALQMQFGDYALLACNREDLSTLEGQLDYWRKRLGDPAYVLELPLDHPRPARRPSACARLSYTLSMELHATIRHLASTHNTTPFVVMLAAFAALLQRYSGQGDVRIAVPLRHRDLASDGTLIGHFMNTAVIRLHVSPADFFPALIEQAKRYLAEAYEQDDLPFSRLVESLRAPRSLAVTPLCQVMFNQLPTFVPQRCGELQVRSFDDAVGRACYDLSLNIAVDAVGGKLFLDYSSTLFDASTARRMLANYLEVLEQMTKATEVVACLRLIDVSDTAVAA